MTDHLPKRPHVCPGCKQNALEAAKNGIDIYGKVTDFILELQGTDADMILLRGWTCKVDNGPQVVFGSVLAYMKDGKRVENLSEDHCYCIFEGDKVSS